jgi:hypothetical protein
MEALAPKSLFYFLAIFSIVSGISACIFLFLGKKYIEPSAMWYLAGGICSTTVGSRICHVWLAVSKPYPLADDFFERIQNVTSMLNILIILFGGLAIHYHWRFFILQSQFKKYYKRFFRYAIPCSVICTELSVILLVFSLWYPQYVYDMKGRKQYDKDIKIETQKYLLNWLKDEPDSKFAKQLLKEHNNEE